MKFPLASILLIFVACFCFIIMFMFDYILFDSDTGIDTQLSEKASELMDTTRYNWYNDIRANLKTGFGMIGVVLFGIAILLFIFTGYQDIGPRREM